MELFKTIFAGRLEFSDKRSYDNVVNLFTHHAENFYKADIALEAEEIFKEEGGYYLDIPRLVSQTSKKRWKNTINLLQKIAAFAILGDISAWRIQDGECVEHYLLEPEGDKRTIRAFLKGRQLIETKSNDEEAINALNLSIEKFKNHSRAYERRGFVNYRLANYKDAIYDYDKSIRLYPDFGQAYLGRAFVYHAMGEFQKALDDLNAAMTKLMPIQPLYFQGRRLKADCHIQLGQEELAIKDLEWFARRDFQPDNSNYKWKRNVYYTLGKLYINKKEFGPAKKTLNAALEMEQGKGGISDEAIKQTLKTAK